MIDYIVKFFSQGQPLDIIGKIVVILAITLFLFLSFNYARRRGLRWLIYIEIATVVFLFALSFFDVDNYIFYVYFILLGQLVANFSFFGYDMSRDLFRRSWRSQATVDTTNNFGREELHNTVDAIVRACQNLSKSDTGALIIVADSISDSIIDSGTTIRANVSNDLLETIFFPKTPLHDGAVVIKATQVLAAGCYLPLTQQLDLPREYGTRHRAAIGICEGNPSVTAIVVSEESGIISAVHDGKVKRYLDADSLRQILELALHLIADDNFDRIWGGKTSL